MTDEVHYFGRRWRGQCQVWRVPGLPGDPKPLDMRLDLWRHSPTGPEWGYCGSGPAQLALAILADALGDDTLAQRLHQRYKREVIGRLEGNSWVIFREDVVRWMTGAVQRLVRREGPDGSPYLDYLDDPPVDLTGPHVPPPGKGGGA